MIYLSEEAKELARRFHETYLALSWGEEGWNVTPPMLGQSVRLLFDFPITDSRASHLLRVLRAASPENLELDATRCRNLFHFLDSLRRAQLDEANEGGQGVVVASQQPLIQTISTRLRQVRKLGEPPYLKLVADAGRAAPDLHAISKARDQYLAALRKIEAQCADLGYSPAAEPERYPTETERFGPCQTVVPVRDFLGGPLAQWVSQLGRSEAATKTITKGKAWKRLVLAFREFHEASGLLEFVPEDIEGGADNPAWHAAKGDLGLALRILMTFLTLITAPSCVVKKTQPATHSDANSPLLEATGEEQSRKSAALSGPCVTIRRSGKTGSPLSIEVNGVELPRRAITVMKVLIACCVLDKKRKKSDSFKSEALKRLVLSEAEFPETQKDHPKFLHNWEKQVDSACKIQLQFEKGRQRFTLGRVVFKTDLSAKVLASALDRLKREHPHGGSKKKPVTAHPVPASVVRSS